MSIDQLKALAYEQIKLLNQTQQNIAVLEQEIAKRQEPKEEIKEPAKE